MLPRAAELAYSRRHLSRLFDAAMVLARFESVERTVPAVLILANEALHVRTTLLIEDRGDAVRVFVWHAPGVAPAELERTQTLARRLFSYLASAAASSQKPREDGSGWDTVTTPLDDLHPASDERPRTRVTLPLVVEGHPVFGLLQASCHATLDTIDVAFLDAIAYQVSVALERARPPGSPSEPPPVKRALQTIMRRHGLTPSELSVVEHAIQGLSNKEIASMLGSSSATIRTHLLHVFAKMKVESRTELAYFVLRASHGG